MVYLESAGPCESYDRTPVAAEKLFQRLCGYMRVDIRGIELEIFADETEELREMLPHWSGNSSGCAGLYMRDRGEEEDRNEKPMVVAIRLHPASGSAFTGG